MSECDAGVVRVDDAGGPKQYVDYELHKGAELAAHECIDELLFAGRIVPAAMSAHLTTPRGPLPQQPDLQPLAVGQRG